MGYPPLEELLPKSNYSIYKLVRMAATRATQLAEGSPKLVESSSEEKTATTSLREIQAGKVVLTSIADQFLPGAAAPKSTEEKS